MPVNTKLALDKFLSWPEQSSGRRSGLHTATVTVDFGVKTKEKPLLPKKPLRPRPWSHFCNVRSSVRFLEMSAMAPHPIRSLVGH